MSTENQDLFGLPDDADMREAILSHSAEVLFEHKWPKRLVEYVEVLEHHYLANKGMTAEEAFALASDSVYQLAEHLGGRVDYLPRGDALRTALRHAEIYRKCNGRNQRELAQEYDVTEIQIYRIYREQRALHIKKRQGTLSLNQQG